MEYILLVVVVLFVLFIAYRDREDRRERAEVTRAHARERSELLTRITHPELVVVPDPDPVRTIATQPDSPVEPDEYGMVGTIVPGLPE